MADNLNVSGSYLKLHTFYDEKDQIVTGKTEFFKDKRFIDISMFSRGVTNDGRKWIADDGYLNVFDKNGEKQKVKRITVDKDNDGFADTYMKVRTLQNGKIKEHKTKYNSEYVDKKLAEYMAITDTDKREKKLEKFKNKLIKSGISEEAIDKKFNQQHYADTAQQNTQVKVGVENFNNYEITKDDIEMMNADSSRERVTLSDKPFSEMTTAEKFKQADNMVALEKQNKSEARRLLLDPNLQDYYKRNPHVLALVAQIAS